MRGHMKQLMHEVALAALYLALLALIIVALLLVFG